MLAEAERCACENLFEFGETLTIFRFGLSPREQQLLDTMLLQPLGGYVSSWSVISQDDVSADLVDRFEIIYL
jgi:hypothetical protein